MEAQERERTYIGHELHDNVSQILITEYSLPEDKKIALFRIVQEQMNNIIKHSRATSFNGVVDIITAPGQGCAVTVLMPYD